MDKKQIIDELIAKILPENGKNYYKFKYFYGYAKGDRTVDKEKAKQFLDYKDVMDNETVKTMLSNDLDFAADAVEMFQYYLKKNHPTSEKENKKNLAFISDAICGLIVRRANTELYKIKQKENPKKETTGLEYSNPNPDEETCDEEIDDLLKGIL